MTDTQKNKGQYFTPEQVVFEMLEKSSEYLSSSKLKVLDPCSGSGNLIKHFESTGYSFVKVVPSISK